MKRMQKLKKLYRDRLVTRAVVNGEKIRDLEVIRAGIDAEHWPLDCAQIDSEITRREQKQVALLERIKETA